MFVPFSWMCKKQTSVSHSWTESEIISLDTGLRLDGLPALELWYLIVSVFGHVSRVSDRSGQPDNDVRKRHESQKKIDVVGRHWFYSLKCPIRKSWSFIVCVWGQWSCDRNDYQRQKAYNETRLQNPQSCSWLVVQSNLSGPQNPNQIRRHQNQFADICGWNHLLCLLNLSLFSSTVCSDTMAKRTSHSKIATDDESCCQDAISRIVFNLSKPGEEILRKSRSMEFYCSRGQIGATW